MTVLPTLKEINRAIQRRDASYDGVFFTAVKTTGIFCRPSCPARTPLPQNREFYATARESLFAGFRPCKRCRPMETDGRPPEWAAHLLKIVDQDPSIRRTDQSLRKIGIDPHRARRYFLRHYNMTFQAYCRGRRMGTALEQIKNGVGLDDVALGNGYDSHSGFREAFRKTFGKAPGKSRAADHLVAAWVESPVGPLVIAAHQNAICLLEFSDRRALETQFAVIRRRHECAIVPGNNAVIDQLKSELKQYFARKLTTFTVPLDYRGSPFQVKVWDRLLKIPYGETLSYEGMALSIGSAGAQRAVGRANGQNRIAIVIPCHRVVNKGGQLGGYGGGLWRKQVLLDLERGLPLSGHA